MDDEFYLPLESSLATGDEGGLALVLDYFPGGRRLCIEAVEGRTAYVCVSDAGVRRDLTPLQAFMWLAGKETQDA